MSASDFTGNEVITYEVSDGEATTSGTLTVTVTAPPATTPTPPANSSGSSGGSMSWFALLALVLIATRRYPPFTFLAHSTTRNI
ncbi:MAG: GlyGly-CTERM sorting domain-containing protein [Glaciecola sp.]|nr:GlyGly-CTERM sorting domain-containing protein [Glaciecola sp.]